MHDPKIGRWWYPQCIGGIYGDHGCTCPRGVKAKQDKIDQLERRIAKLEEATVMDRLFDAETPSGKIKEQ